MHDGVTGILSNTFRFTLQIYIAEFFMSRRSRPRHGISQRLTDEDRGETAETSALQVERRFKWVWADHGDDISRQYAGTGALKSGFTRTGQRTVGGLLDDGWKSAVRYFLNNFHDGRKQDALDLLTGTYSVSKGVSCAHGLRMDAAVLLYQGCPCCQWRVCSCMAGCCSTWWQLSCSLRHVFLALRAWPSES